jgi:hypothetical protein
MAAIYRSVTRNEFYFTVEFPADWADEPNLAGTRQTFYYRTERMAIEAREGFRARGAVC